MIKAAEKASGREIKYEMDLRRAGDPAVLVASSEKIKRELGWEPKRGLDVIMSSAWRFHKEHPNGY